MKFKYHILLILCISIQLLNAQSDAVNNAAGSAIQIHSGSQVGFFGNLNNDGSFTENEGEVGFYNQEEVQNITGENAPEISDLIVDVPNDLNIEVKTIIKTGVIFNQGRVLTPRIDPSVSLDLQQTDLYINEGNDTHVDGYTSYTGNNAYTFPIGDDFRLRPVSIESNVFGITSKAAYFFEDPNTPDTFAGFDREERDNDVGSVSSVEFWDLDAEFMTKVTLTWDMFSNVSDLTTANDISDLFVVGWSIAEQKWVNLGNTNVTGDENQGTLTSETFVPNRYEVITFGGFVKTFVADGEIFVFNAISDNGDDLNAYFRIVGIDNFPNNSLKIFNRWGLLVFEKDGYTDPKSENGGVINDKEVFTGIANVKNVVRVKKRLPSGTYFYVLDYGAKGAEQKRKAGYLYLKQ